MNAAGDIKAHGHAVGGLAAEAKAAGSVGPNGASGELTAKIGPYGEVGGQLGTKHNYVKGAVTGGEFGGKGKIDVHSSESNRHIVGDVEVAGGAGCGGMAGCVGRIRKPTWMGGSKLVLLQNLNEEIADFNQYELEELDGYQPEVLQDLQFETEEYSPYELQDLQGYENEYYGL